MNTRFAVLSLAVASLTGCMVAMEPAAHEGVSLACGPAADELRVCAAGPTVSGVDVSYWQSTVDWTKVKAAGHVFGFARISDGLRYVDNQFANNWRGMKAQGLVRGAYQFFRSNLDPVAQADLALTQLAAAGGLEDGDLSIVLDIESTDGQSAATVVTRAKQWLQHIEDRTGRRPIVYTAAFMSSTIGSALSGYPLWVANYQASCPTMPSGWGGWKIWQYSDAGHIAGISGNFDVNVFNGNLDALHAFAASLVVNGSGGTVNPTPPPPQEPAACTVATPTGLQGGSLNIRPTAATTRAAMGTLREGQQVPVLDRTNGEQVGNTRRWVKIRSSAGITGWVSGRYMRCVGAGVLYTGDGSAQPADADMGFVEGRGMGQGDGTPGPSTEVIPAPCGLGG